MTQMRNQSSLISEIEIFALLSKGMCRVDRSRNQNEFISEAKNSYTLPYRRNVNLHQKLLPFTLLPFLEYYYNIPSIISFDNLLCLLTIIRSPGNVFS